MLFHNQDSHNWSFLVLTTIGLVTLFLITGCATAASIPEITIKDTDYSFEAPESIPAGLVRVKQTNAGQELHHVQFMRLNDGVNFEQFIAALQKGPEQALPLVSLMGGPSFIAPGATSAVILNLTAGQYVLACFLPSPDGMPHLAKGMIKPIQVTAPTGARPAEPQVAGTMRLKDFAFDMPDTLPAGQATFKVINDGPQPHEMALLRLADGKSPADVVQFFGQPNGPPPFTAVGGMQGLNPGQSAFLVSDLTPGRYMATCAIPDRTSGKPHSALGMVREFTVK